MGLPDVTIVGGGVIGCAIGLRLAQAGARVTLFERSTPGAEASSAAAGILAPQLEAEGPGLFLELCLRSRSMYPAFVAELEELSGIPVNYLPCGVVSVALSEEAAFAMPATVAWQRALGLRAELLSPAEALTLEPRLTPKVVAAIHLPDDHQVDNRLLVKALFLSAERAGVELRTGYVRNVVSEADRVIGVDVDGERVSSAAVVIAAGSWSGLIPGVCIDPKSVTPVRGQMVQLRTRPPLFTRVLVHADEYLVPRVDGRVVAGSTLEFVGFEKQVTTRGLSKILCAALELCPGLAEAPVLEFWSGLRPCTVDHHPILGPGPLRGLFFATGHYRNGILLTPVTAQLIAQAVLGEKIAVDLRPFTYQRLEKGARDWRNPDTASNIARRGSQHPHSANPDRR